MLNLNDIDLSNKIAPDVYITSADVYKSDNKNKISIEFKLYDKLSDGNYTWIDDVDALSSFYVNLTLSGSKDYYNKKLPLSGLSKKNNNILHGKYEFNISEPVVDQDYFLNITASCGNEEIVGITTSERLFTEDKLSVQENYISKIKDLRLLETNFAPRSNFSASSTATVFSDLPYVTYTTEKVCKFSFIVNLDNYFSGSGNQYYMLMQQYPTYKNYIISSSYIDPAGSAIYIADATNHEIDFRKAEADMKIYPLGDSAGRHLITFDIPFTSDHKYYVKAKISIKDIAKDFFNKHVYDRLLTFREILQEYKLKFETYGINRFIDDPGKYYFINDYDQKINFLIKGQKNISSVERYTVYSHIATEISEVASIFSQVNFTDFLTLISSILHPLTTSSTLIDKLLFKLDELISISHQYVFPNSFSIDLPTNDIDNSIEKQYGTMKTPVIDMSYPINCGFEVISSEALDSRKKAPNGLYELSASGSLARKYLESSKYFNSPSDTTRTSVSTYSISQVDLSDRSFDLLLGNLTNTEIYNSAYVYTSEYNKSHIKSATVAEIDYSFTHNFDKFGSIFTQMFNAGIDIDSISNRNNGSSNVLAPNTIFDPNNDTRDISLRFISDTNIQNLFLSLDGIKYNEFDPNDTYMQAIATTQITQEPRLVIRPNMIEQDVSLKPKTIFYYDSIFQDNIIYSGSYYEFHSLDDLKINTDLFGKLKHFNKYYIIKLMEPPIETNLNIDFDNTSAMKLDTSSDLMFRTEQQENISLTTEDI